MNYSITQAGNITALIGVVMLILNYFKINIAREEVEALVGGIVSILGIAVSWYGRYRQGDLRPSGIRKARPGTRRRY